MSSSSSAFSDLDLDKLLSTQDIFNSQDDNSSNKVNPHRNADVQQLIRHWRNEKVRIKFFLAPKNKNVFLF